MGLYVNYAYEGKNEDIYYLYYTLGDDYQLYDSYNLHSLKKGLNISLNCVLRHSEGVCFSMVLANTSLGSIKDIDSYAKNVFMEDLFSPCARPVTFENNIASELRKLNLLLDVLDSHSSLNDLVTQKDCADIMKCLIGKTIESSDREITGNEFVIALLNGLGYQGDANLATDLGVLTCAVDIDENFCLADCLSMVYNALAVKLNSEDLTLAEKLIADGVFTKDAFDDAVKSVPDYAGLIKAYGLEGVQWYKYPRNSNELTSNFFQCFLRGEYEFTDDMPNSMVTMDQSELFTKTYNTIMQPLEHMLYTLGYQNGKFYIRMNRANPLLSPEEISNRMIKAYQAAEKIRDDIYAKGLITPGMNDLAIAKVYSDYLMQNVPPTTEPVEIAQMDGHADDFSPAERGRYFLYNGVYSVLVESTGTCTDHAATYQLFMNIEDIGAVPLLMTGHMTTLMIIDGVEYSCDWGNKFGIIPVSQVPNVMQMTVFEDSLKRGRKVLENPLAYDLYEWN